MSKQGKRGQLQAGQAPSCWRRQIGHAARRVHLLTTACAWLEKLAVERPRIRTEPLLGRCLAAVANQEPPPPLEETAPSAFKPARAPAAAPLDKPITAPNSERNQPTRRPKWSAADRQERPRPTLTEQKQADAALLHRLAGPSGPSPRSLKSVSLPSAPPATRHLSPTPVAEPMQAKAKLSERVSQRAANRLRSPGGEGLSTPPEAFSSEVSHAMAAKTARLAQQWTQPLTGQRATGAQLHYWAQRQRVASAAQPATNRPAASHPTPAADPAGPRTSMPEAAANRPAYRHAPTPASTLSAGSRYADGVISGSARAHKAEAVALTSAAPAAGQNGPFSGQNDEIGGFHTSTADASDPMVNTPPVAPPQIAQKLPQLTAPHTPEQAPMPVATATARQSALSNLLSDDDLGGLAANIKRILDAEARRYGIDV